MGVISDKKLEGVTVNVCQSLLAGKVPLHETKITYCGFIKFHEIGLLLVSRKYDVVLIQEQEKLCYFIFLSKSVFIKL